MRRFLRDNGLSLTLFALFLVSFIGHALTGWKANAEELRLHELPEIGFVTYLTSGHFISATFENWKASSSRWPPKCCSPCSYSIRARPSPRSPMKTTPRTSLRINGAASRMHRVSIGVACC